MRSVGAEECLFHSHSGQYAPQ